MQESAKSFVHKCQQLAIEGLEGLGLSQTVVATHVILPVMDEGGRRISIVWCHGAL